MALPADVNYITVTGTFIDLHGDAMVGAVTFTPSFADVLVDLAFKRIIGKSSFVAPLDFEGHFSIALPATDDPDLTPTGFTYKVTEPRGSGRVYNMVLPVDTLSGSIDLFQVVPSGAANPGTVQLVEGVPGPAGPATSLNVISATASEPGGDPEVTVTGTAPTQHLSFILPRGEPSTVPGPTGPTNELSVGSVTTGAAGTDADVTITGAAPSQVVSFVIPRGVDGTGGGGGGGGIEPPASGAAAYALLGRNAANDAQGWFTSSSVVARALGWALIDDNGGGPTKTAAQNDAAWTAAVASLPALGGTVYLGPGTYLHNQPWDLPVSATTAAGPSVRVYGAGRQATKLRATTGMAAQIRQQAPATWHTGGAHEIAHLWLDANKFASRNIDLANGHGCHIHNLYASDPAVADGSSNVRIWAPTNISWENTIGPAVRLEGGSGTDQGQWAPHNLEVLSSDNYITEVIVVRARTANVRNTGGNNFYKSLHAFYGPVAFYSESVFGSSWIDCEADGPDQYGFLVEASNTKIMGCRVFWPTTPVGTAQGIRLVYPITESLITGNHITDVPGDRRVVSVGRVDLTTRITNNLGATLDTGPYQAGPRNISMQYPDSTTGGGEPRGVGAADFQFGRSQNTQVASGEASFALGYGNTASGYGSSARGSLNVASAAQSEAVGLRSRSDTTSKQTQAGGQFAATGDQQIGRGVLAAATSSTTKTRLTVGGQGLGFVNVINQAPARAFMCTVALAGYCPATGDAGSWTATGVVVRPTTGTPTLTGTPAWTMQQASTAAAAAVPELVADATYGGPAVSVTAPNTSTWHWVARVETVEVG